MGAGSSELSAVVPNIGNYSVTDLGFLVVVTMSLGKHDLGVRIGDLLDDFAELEELDLTELVVVAGVDLAIQAVPLTGSLLHRLFEGADDLVRIDPLVAGDLIDFSF